MGNQVDNSKNTEKTTGNIFTKFILWVIGLIFGIPAVIYLVIVVVFTFYGFAQEQEYKKRHEMDVANSAASKVLIEENSFIERGIARSEGAPYEKSEISGDLSKSAYSNPDGFATSMEKMIGAEHVATVILEYSYDKTLTVQHPSSDSVPSLTHQGWIDLLKMTENPEIEHIEVDDQGETLVTLAPYKYREDDDIDLRRKDQEDYSRGLDSVAHLTAPDGLEKLTFEDGYTYKGEAEHLAVHVTGDLQTLQLTENLAQNIAEHRWPQSLQKLSVSETRDNSREALLELERFPHDVSQPFLEAERSIVQPIAQQVIDEAQAPVSLYVYSGYEELLTLEKL